IYGVINWKHVGVDDEAQEPHAEAVELPRVEFATSDDAHDESEAAIEPTEVVEPVIDEPLELTDFADQPAVADVDFAPESEQPVNLDIAPQEQFEEPIEAPAPVVAMDAEPTATVTPEVHFSWEDGPLADVESDEL